MNPTPGQVAVPVQWLRNTTKGPDSRAHAFDQRPNPVDGKLSQLSLCKMMRRPPEVTHADTPLLLYRCLHCVRKLDRMRAIAMTTDSQAHRSSSGEEGS